MSALLIIMLSLSASEPLPSEDIVRVKSTVARLRQAPNKGAKVVARLPMGAELLLEKKSGAYLFVRTLDQKSGFVSRSLVQKEALPTMRDYEEKLATSQGKTRRQLLERRVAQFPLSLEAIEGYQAYVAEGVSERSLKKARAQKTKFKSSDFGKGGAAKLYFLRKGWVAAKRKSLSPKGPLYPIVDGVAILPLSCEEGADANGARSPKSIGNLELRARATKIASSGKVVSVSEGGYKTQKLDRPLCKEGHLAYKMKSAKKGALVPSWLVAGYHVSPFTSVEAGVFSASDARVQAEFRQGKITVGQRTNRIEAEVPASFVPVALMSVQAGEADVIYAVPPGPECRGPSLRLDHYDFANKTTQEGVLYSFQSEGPCKSTVYSALEGEPRDIGVKNMLSSEWNR